MITGRYPFSFFKKSPRYIVVLGLIVLFLVLSSADAFAARNRKAALEPRKYGAIVVDATTGQVLMSDNPDKQLHPASLTKMMTLLLTFDALSSGQLRTSDYIRISRHAASQSPSKLGIKAGGRIRVDDAIRAIAIKSANDISAAMAEALGGSESRFAQRMTARAREIGMSKSHFVNASGLHSAFQLSTPRDMAILARYIIVTYPSYYKYFGLRSFNYGGKSHPNHNRLMGSYYGMDGMKTGFINASGFNLVASAKRDGRRLIGVVFGGRTSSSRNAHMAKILDAAFAVPRLPMKPKIDVARLKPFPPAPVNNDDEYIADASEDADKMARLRPESGSIPDTDDMTPQNDARAPAKILNKSSKSLKHARVRPTRKPFEVETDTLAMNLPSRIERPRLEPGRRGAVSTNGWAVQIGAYQTRDATDAALYQALRKLPNGLSHATPTVAPLKSSQDGWMFRARLGNLNQSQAAQTCQLFSGCVLIPPVQN